MMLEDLHSSILLRESLLGMLDIEQQGKYR
jgi:hypothetical protein